MELADKYQQLTRLLQNYEKVAVAFSGGVDSTLLLKVAAETLGTEQVLALTATSSLHPQRETEQSKSLAASIGVQQLLVTQDDLSIPEVATNQPRRCYHCKHALFSRLQQLAEDNGCQVLIEGSNLDDQDDYRPGQQAIQELQVPSPLLAAGLTKQEIRVLSHQLGLATADKASFACLASRFPYGTALSLERLRQVEHCEDWLQQQGFRNYRVRFHDQLARIELAPDDFPRLIAEPLREQLVTEFRATGFQYIALDLQGYRTGSMNEPLAPEDNS